MMQINFHPLDTLACGPRRTHTEKLHATCNSSLEFNSNKIFFPQNIKKHIVIMIPKKFVFFFKLSAQKMGA